MTSLRNTQRAIRAHLVAIAAVAIFLVGIIGVIGANTELAGAVIAPGTLVVQSNVKKVQHPTGGIVGELAVHDGTRVQAGELLIRLDATLAQANPAMVEKSLAELFARRARLEAERDGSDAVEFPDELIGQAAQQADIARVVAGERRLFELRREAQDGQKAQLRERIAQVRGYTDQVAAKLKEIEFIGKELEGVRELWQKNLIPINRVTALERDSARLEGERGQLIGTIAQGKGKVSETELQIIQLDQNLRSDVAKELADIRAKIAELVERKVTAMDQLQRIDIRAPQSGVVYQLSVHTKGGVVASGEQIMLHSSSTTSHSSARSSQPCFRPCSPWRSSDHGN
jgi:HlyD family secretion protein